ncbi:MAG: autotransporter-associated beta strand repeat-containing protein, partial [Phycisphaerales bacterium]|nr:autotransporter-associated beta strand repeat-containing protein [Phycisphaerales bacterium]
MFSHEAISESFAREANVKMGGGGSLGHLKGVGGRLFKRYGVLSAMAVAAAMQMQAASGASFMWNGGTSNAWDTAANWSGGTPTWASGDNDTATFNNTGANGPNIRLDSAVFLRQITFSDGTLWNLGGAVGSTGTLAADLTGGTLTLAAPNGTTTNGTATIRATIIDNNNSTLTKTGAGTIIVSGMNTYAGGTILAANSGQLSLGASDGTTYGPLGVVPTDKTAGIGNIRINGASALGTGANAGPVTLSENRGITLAAGTASVVLRAGPDVDDTFTYNGDIIGTGSVTFASNSSFIYRGGTTNTTGTLTLQGSGIINLTGTHTFTGNITFTANGIINVTGDNVITSIGGTVSMTGTGSIYLAGNDIITSPGAVTITATGGSNFNIQGSNPGLTGRATVSVGATGSTPSRVTLGGANGFTADSTFTIAGGNGGNSGASWLTIGCDEALGAAPLTPVRQITFNNGAQGQQWGGLLLDYTGILAATRNMSIGAASGNGGGTIIAVSTGNTVSYGGSIRWNNVYHGDTALQLGRPADTGTLVLTGPMAYTGKIVVNSGIVRVTHPQALGFGGIISNGIIGASAGGVVGTNVTNGGTLDIYGMEFTGPITLNGSSLTNSSNSPTTLTGGVAGVRVGQNINASNIATSPLFEVAPTINFSGGSTATAQVWLGIRNDTWNNFETDGSFDPGTVTVTIGAPDLPGGTQATATVNLNGDRQVTGIMITNAGSGYTQEPTLTFNGTGATVTQDYRGLVVIGIQQLTPGNNLSATPTVSFSPTASVTGSTTYTAFISGVTLTGAANTIGGDQGDMQIDGLISSSGGFSKTGSNSLILTNANTYTGGTTIREGTLVAANGVTGSATGTAAVTVGGVDELDAVLHATLASNANGGRITGPVAIKNGSTLAPSQFGYLTLTGVVTLEAGSELDFGFGAFVPIDDMNAFDYGMAGLSDR